jgi:hypothetical protein
MRYPSALPKNTHIIDNLTYKGFDGSLGYRKGKTYSLRVGLNNKKQIVICRLNFEGINIYETEKSFFALWGQKQIIRKIKLLQLENELV